MTMSNYPSGFVNGVSVRGVPLMQTHPGNIYWVNNSGVLPDQGIGASDGNKGTYHQPFSTIDYAIGRCTANRGDIIMVMPGHAETVSTASGITADVAGITIIGLGSGAKRPTLTFSATDATMVVSASSVTIQNIITKPSIDSVVSPIVVSGADCWLDIEHQDASATVEAVRAVLTTATAERLHIDLKYVGFIAGNACVNAVRLVGCDTGDINVDFYGVASTSIVEFHTTACHNIKVSGTHYNSGTTDLSKNVVDTVTGSTWSVSAYDAAAAANYSGGSGQAVAKDDVGAVTAAIGTITNTGGTATIGGVLGDFANDSLVARLDDIGSDVNSTTTDNIQGKIGTDTEMADRSLFDILGGTGLAAFPTAAVAANDVSLAEVIRYISENQSGRWVSKAYADLTGYDTAAAFTVTGDVMVRVVGVVGATAITSTSGTTTLAVGTTELTTSIIAASTIDNAQFEATDVWVDSTPTNDSERMTEDWVIVGGGADIILTRSADDITAGSLTLYCEWKPLSSDGAIVAA